jgi:mono/diheme cytochrome c family protein
VLLASLLALAPHSGWATSNQVQLKRGREVYENACIACHGRDGKGNPEWESAVRPVSFADCSTTAEPTTLWKSVVQNGGRRHGLAEVMPAFGEAFPPEDLDAVVAYLRTFCAKADEYPPGDLNFRRLLATDKAFPEAEVVVSTTAVPDTGETELEVAYENRIGTRFQYELEFPLRPAATKEGHTAGVGDVVIAGKYVLHFNRAGRRILSGGLEVSLPTGNEENELGAGTPVFVPFLNFAQGVGPTVLQTQIAVDLPADTSRASRTIKYSLGYSLPPIGFSRTGFIPALELTGIYNPKNSSRENTVVIGVSKALNKLGHVIASMGIGFPLTPSEGPRPKEFRAHLVWDFGDGPFWTGW